MNVLRMNSKKHGISYRIVCSPSHGNKNLFLAMSRMKSNQNFQTLLSTRQQILEHFKKPKADTTTRMQLFQK